MGASLMEGVLVRALRLLGALAGIPAGAGNVMLAAGFGPRQAHSGHSRWGRTLSVLMTRRGLAQRAAG